MAFLGVPIYVQDLKEWCRLLAVSINNILQGKTNNTDTFTLAITAATTTVTVAAGRLGSGTVILFTPTTANAASEFGAGKMYVSSTSVTNNTFTITHTNGPTSDRTFTYVLIG